MTDIYEMSGDGREIDLSPLDYDDPLTLLEEDYNREGPKRVLLVIQWDRDRITAETRDPTIDGTTEARWHGLEGAYDLDPLTDATALREWVETEVLPHTLSLFAAFRRDWDGNNWIGTFPGHEGEKEEFGEWMDHHKPPILGGEVAGLWDVRDWLVDIPEGLRSDTTDSALDALADEIVAEARRENVVLTGDVVAHLTEIRDEMREASPSPDRYEIDGYEVFERTAKPYGTGAYVSVPRKDIGRRFKVVLVDPRRGRRK